MSDIEQELTEIIKVHWDFPLINADKTYISCVFDWNKELTEQYEGLDNYYIGGSGYSLTSQLSEEIEAIKPKINLGFTTRGCIRNCPFCIVPRKEGKIKVVGDIYDIWDSKSKNIVILDNNILALPKHFKAIAQQIRTENLRVDFNQGLDHRLLTEDICNELLSLKHQYEIRFAFDDIRDKTTVLKALKLLKEAGLKDWRSRWYVYIGEKDTFVTIYERMNILREHKQAVYVMRDKKVYENPEYIALASWGNTIGAFKLASLSEILKRSKRMKPYKKYFEKYL